MCRTSKWFYNKKKWLKLQVANFHIFYASFLPSIASTVQESSSSKLPVILDGFLLCVDCIRQVPTWVGGGEGKGLNGDFNVFLEKV